MLFLSFLFFLMIRRPPRSTLTDTLFPYTTLFRSAMATILPSAWKRFTAALLSSGSTRSEEHTSGTPVTNAHLVCRLLLEKKKKQNDNKTRTQQEDIITHI